MHIEVWIEILAFKKRWYIKNDFFFQITMCLFVIKILFWNDQIFNVNGDIKLISALYKAPGACVHKHLNFTHFTHKNSAYVCNNRD